MRAGLVATGVFLFAIGVMTFTLGGEKYLTNVSTIPPTYEGNYACLPGFCTIYVTSVWGFYVQIAGGLLVASGLAITVYGALKKEEREPQTPEPIQRDKSQADNTESPPRNTTGSHPETQQSP